MKVARIIALPIICAISLFAIQAHSQNNKSSINASDSLMQASESTEQKKIKTSADLQHFISMLETLYKLGDKSKGYLLGGIYAQEHALEDKVVSANKPLALKFFNETLNAGYGLSAWNITMLDLLPKGDYLKALETLEKGLSSKLLDKDARISISLTYGTIVLENLNENSTAVQRARDIIYPLAVNNNLASLDYVIANLLNLNNELDEANKFLNSACNNPDAPKEILNACMGGSEVVTSDQKGQIVQRDLAQCGQP